MANSNLVNSILKALDVLKLVGESENGMRLSEIAEAMNMRLPATHNIIRTLQARGFLEKRSGNRLFIGRVMQDITAQQQNGLLSRLAEKELRRLYDLMQNGVVIFGVAAESEIRQTLRMSPERPQVLQRLGGDSYHPYASAAGLVGLAFMPESYQLQTEKLHPFAEYGMHLWHSRENFDRYLEKVRREKMSICPFNAENFLRVSMPVLDRSKHLVAVFGVNLPVSDVKGKYSTENIINYLREATTNLERSLFDED